MTDTTLTPTLHVRPLRSRPYLECLQAMRLFNQQRNGATDDEIWLVEHGAVFTQGLAGKPEHVLDAGDIPVVQTERGGQVTYHGPGQVVAYLLLDLRRRKLTIKDLVCRMEQAVIDYLATLNLHAQRRAGAPGVYICAPSPLAGSKIAALGLKVSRGCTFHGLALNVSMDLAPFERINPCGYQGLRVTDIHSLIGPVSLSDAANGLARSLIDVLDDANKDKGFP